MCNKGCYEVGMIYYNIDDETGECDLYENEEKHYDKLSKFAAFHEMGDGIFGHINYQLASYCVSIGHYDCLKKLHRNIPEFMWHSDLGECAIEKNCDVKILQYIIENMGHICISDDIDVSKINKDCKKYLYNLINTYAKKNGQLITKRTGIYTYIYIDKYDLEISKKLYDTYN